jgi:methylase of polypeptide subunit release factors
MKGFYRQVASEVAVELRQGRILDVGTGPGYLPIEIARSIPGVEVVGIDVSSDMVEMARKNAERAGLSGRVVGPSPALPCTWPRSTRTATRRWA